MAAMQVRSPQGCHGASAQPPRRQILHWMLLHESVCSMTARDWSLHVRTQHRAINKCVTVLGTHTQDELGQDAVTGVVSVAAPEDGEEGVSIHFEACPSVPSVGTTWTGLRYSVLG